MEQRFGKGDVGWLEQRQPGAVLNAVVVIYDSTGKSMLTSAMRTVNVPVGSMYVGEDIFLYVDNPRGATTGYAKYIEAHLMPEAAPGSIAQALEMDLINHKPPAETNPYSPNTPGLTELLRMATVGQNGVSPYPGSHALMIGGGGPGFLRGIVADITMAGRELMAMAQGVLIGWWCPPTANQPARPGPHIRSDCADSGNAMRMIFFDGGLALQTPDGINRHIFWNDGRYTNTAQPQERQQ